MPELPEVETIKEILNPIVKDKTIKSIEILRPSTIVSPINEFKEKLVFNTFRSVSRKGKFLIFHLDNDVVMLSHLRMEGKYYYYQNQNNHSRFERIRFNFSDGSLLVYDDSRMFGIMMLKNENTYIKEPPISLLGKEPFDADANEVYKCFQRGSRPIKIACMDQNIMAGLGNIYADEVMFLTKLHPETPSNLITLEETKNIIEMAKIVLSKAIKEGGSTIRSYHPSQGADGNFQVHLNVYGKIGSLCPNCNTPLEKIRVGGRGTTFCPKCQKNRALPLSIGLTGPIASGKSYVGKYLQNKGFIRIDSDEIVKKLYQDQNIQNEIVKMFNLNLFSKEEIKTAIINDLKKKNRLERYIHPLVKEEIKKEIKKLNHNDKVVVEVPLLFESKLESLFDYTIYVDIDKEKQIKNLNNRHSDVNSSLELNKTFNKELDKEKATFVIKNRSTIQDLEKEIDKLLIKFRR